MSPSGTDTGLLHPRGSRRGVWVFLGALGLLGAMVLVGEAAGVRIRPFDDSGRALSHAVAGGAVATAPGAAPFQILGRTSKRRSQLLHSCCATNEADMSAGSAMEELHEKVRRLEAENAELKESMVKLGKGLTGHVFPTKTEQAKDPVPFEHGRHPHVQTHDEHVEEEGSDAAANGEDSAAPQPSADQVLDFSYASTYTNGLQTAEDDPESAYLDISDEIYQQNSQNFHRYLQQRRKKQLGQVSEQIETLRRQIADRREDDDDIWRCQSRSLIQAAKERAAKKERASKKMEMLGKQKELGAKLQNAVMEKQRSLENRMPLPEKDRFAYQDPWLRESNAPEKGCIEGYRGEGELCWEQTEDELEVKMTDMLGLINRISQFSIDFLEDSFIVMNRDGTRKYYTFNLGGKIDPYHSGWTWCEYYSESINLHLDKAKDSRGMWKKPIRSAIKHGHG
mmetsp:Transcript_3678/g.6840  ORF Transcript_3678/g.6840 Transcript_3678/m.6840 type:complete len:452 (-) Transcript_3678:293-1648(-)|eukprot:CAMPEP_0197525496 /NCGR_PEP_ID=MMETSP1318-20131121/12835_1 /TAXON_ID=552666 /ORGANISM="Partenskyella glossopodia, Strain RCC365" /LENGTH=451 /DNA_ID=CAMNT_0043079005 /DNA_START=25 /DNA_END=1380 /DNA_ORIENTATION=+